MKLCGLLLAALLLSGCGYYEFPYARHHSEHHPYFAGSTYYICYPKVSDAELIAGWTWPSVGGYGGEYEPGWYFSTETWEGFSGPYRTREEAGKYLLAYCGRITGGKSSGEMK